MSDLVRDCSNERRMLGLAYPRTCRRCGLGPCTGTTSATAPEPTPVDPRDAEIASLRAKLSRLSALVTWQDIETAPKTGVFLVYAPDRKDGRKPYVGGSNFAVMVRHENVTLVGGNFAFDVPSPAHWLPLSAPPVSQLKDTTNADK